MKIFYQNIRSIRGRLTDFRINLKLIGDFDIIVLTETWLSDEILDTELGLSQYNIFRCDRTYHTSQRSYGGGVLIAVSKKLNSFLVPLVDNFYEQLLVCLILNNSHFIIGATYISPDFSSDYYEGFVENLQNSLYNFSFFNYICSSVFLGDFNLPGYKWINNNNFATAIGHHENLKIRVSSSLLSDFCKLFKLSQYNTTVNSCNNILDLVISNVDKIQVSPSDDAIFDCDAFHSALNINVPVYFRPKLDYTEYFYDFQRAEYDKINIELNRFDWSMYNDPNLDIEYFVQLLNDRITGIIDKFVPKFIVKPSNYPRWFSSSLIKSIKDKKYYHKLYKEYKSNYYLNKFHEARSLCKKLRDIDKNKFIGSVESSVLDDGKYFFNYINSLSSNKELPSVMYLGDKTANSGSGIAELFASKFGNVYNNIDLSATPVNFDVPDCISNLSFTKDEVLKSIEDINAKSSPGPDLIHPLIIKNCSELLAPLLTSIFNHSIKTGKFPFQWKVSFITPYFKSGDKADISNYRPICKQNIISKIFDKLVHDKLSTYLLRFIIPEQHGFMKNKSTLTNLSEYIEYLIHHMSDDETVLSLYTDFKVAFDSVNLGLLIRKLAAYGIHGNLLSWFVSLLSSRTQIVKIKNYQSDPINVTSGVGQGTHLGPLLFLLFINDINSGIKSAKLLLFADDLKLFKVMRYLSDVTKFQSDIDFLLSWSILNGIYFNFKKCFCIQTGKPLILGNFKLSDHILEFVTTIKDLGVIFDSKLTFQRHIEYTKSKATKSLNFIKRFSSDFNKPEVFRKLYYSFIYPILSYGSVIWNPYVRLQIDSLEKVRHKFLRFAAFKVNKPMKFNNHNYTEISDYLIIPTLESARKRTDLLFGFCILTQNLVSHILMSKFNFHVPARILRDMDSYFYTSICDNNLINHSPAHRISILLNENANWVDIYNSTLSTIKGQSKQVLVYN